MAIEIKDEQAQASEEMCGAGMEMPKPQPEHLWLQKLVGEWVYEMECDFGDGQMQKVTEFLTHLEKLPAPLQEFWKNSFGTPPAPTPSAVPESHHH